jgi:hypothetical protein
MARAADRIHIVLTSLQTMTSRTELTVVTGERYRIEGDPKEVEQTILDAARGSLMQLAWLVEADTEQQLGVNPDHVVTLRAAGD